MNQRVSEEARDEIARIAHAIWEAEGCPEGRDHEHWMRAKQLIAEGRAEVEFPQAGAPGGDGPGASASVEAGGAEAASGPGADSRAQEGAGPRDAPGGAVEGGRSDLPNDPNATDAPGPRNPDPLPPTNKEGFVAI